MSLKKILIVDDEPDVVTYLTTVLKSNGYKSYSAANIKSAMQLTKEIHPDLICLDIVMPNETGISFYIKLQQDQKLKNIPVILISGIIESEKFNFRSYVKDTTISPPECYMEKPLDITNFISNVEKLTH
jgi:CheY-like chemotaxis protein